MKAIFGVLAVCALSAVAQAQANTCLRPEMSNKQLNAWIGQARTPEAKGEIVCYLRAQSTHFEELAAKEDAALEFAYEHHVGGSKNPTAADHARIYRAVYREKARRYSTLAHKLAPNGTAVAANS